MRKHCSNPACAAKGTDVETKAERCVLCTRALVPAVDLGDILGGLFSVG